MECPACHSPLIADAAFCPRCGAHIDGAPRYDEYAYEAFISYKHHKRDGALAKRIQRAIEGRRLPRDIGGNRAGERLGKCFRDEDELHSSDSLPALIEDALKHARYLIVICSPEMRASAWVAREVELFASYHGRDKILPVLAEGEPADSFPPLLMTRLEPEGDAYVERPAEPLAADMRDSSYKHFSAEVLRLVAPIAGCGYDDLRQRERTRRLTRIAVGAAAAAVVAAGFGAFALFQQTQIQTNLNAALKNESEYLAEEATTILEQGDRLQAVQVALHALGDGEGVNRPYTPSARLALEEACQIYPGNYWRPVYANYEDQSFFDTIELSENCAFYAVELTNYDIRVYDVETGLSTCTIDNSKREDLCSTYSFAGETLVVAYTSGAVEGYDPSTGEQLFQVDLGLDPDSFISPELITPSPDGTTAAITSYDFASGSPTDLYVSLLDITTGTISLSWELPGTTVLGDYEYTSIDPFSAAFSEDGNLFAQSLGDAITVLDRSSNTWTTCAIDSGVATDMRIEDALYLTTFEEDPAGSHFTVGRIDFESFSQIWNYDIEAITATVTEDVYLPILSHTIDKEGTRLLPVAYGDRITYLSCQDGSIALEVISDGKVETLAHTIEGTNVAYVSDGHISTIYDPFARSDNAILGVKDSSLPSTGPYSSGYGDDTNAEGIRVFSLGDETYCLLANSSDNRTLVYRYDLMQQALPGRIELDERTRSPFRDYDSMLRSASGTYRALLDRTTTETITFYDGNTFEVISTASFPDLFEREDNVTETTGSSSSFINVECAFSIEHEELLYVVWDNYSESSLLAIDVSTGTVVGRYDEPENGLSIQEIAQYHDELLYIDQCFNSETLSYDYYLVHLDAQTLEECSRTVIRSGADESVVIQEFATVGSNALIRWSNISFDRIDAIDIETGREVDSSIARNLSDSHRAQTFLADETHGRLICGIDSTITLYDSNLDELWSYRLDGVSGRYADFVSSGDVIVQSNTGELIWLDGDTGTVIARTTTLPDTISINRTWASSDGTHLYCESYHNVFTINLDPAAFDVDSSISCGIALSQDEQRVLVHDDYDTYVLPTYTTDELIDYAQGIIEGHELTREERRRYHIE